MQSLRDELIAETADHVIMSPCSHVLCTFCAIKSLMKRGIRPVLCPVKDCGCSSEDEGKQFSDSCKHFASIYNSCHAHALGCLTPALVFLFVDRR